MDVQESLLTREEVERRVGLSRSTIYARMAAGTFPAARREIETGNVRWLASEVDAWIADWITKAEPVVGTVVGSRRARMKKPLKSAA
jgi:prophage regulatory protein